MSLILKRPGTGHLQHKENLNLQSTRKQAFVTFPYERVRKRVCLTDINISAVIYTSIIDTRQEDLWMDLKQYNPAMLAGQWRQGRGVGKESIYRYTPTKK